MISTHEKREMGSDPYNTAQVFVKQYKILLGEKAAIRMKAKKSILRNGPVLSINQQLRLVKPFSANDVKQVMFMIN